MRLSYANKLEIFLIKTVKCRVALLVYKNKFAAPQENLYKILQLSYKRRFINNRSRLDTEFFQERLNRIILQSVSVIRILCYGCYSDHIILSVKSTALSEFSVKLLKQLRA